MSDPPANPVGTLIRSARELQVPKMSIRAAAARIGLSPEQWGNIERGYRYAKEGDAPREFAPPAPTIAKMANVVGVTPAQLTAAGRADAAAALEKLQRHDQPAEPLASAPALAVVPDGIDGSVHDLVARILTDELELLIWNTTSVPESERLRQINALRAKRAELAAELNGGQEHGTALTIASS